MDWGQNISDISSKETKSLSFLSRNLAFAPWSTKEATYKTLECPKLEYAAFIWSPSCKTQISIYFLIRLNPRGGCQTGIPEYGIPSGSTVQPIMEKSLKPIKVQQYARFPETQSLTSTGTGLRHHSTIQPGLHQVEMVPRRSARFVANRYRNTSSVKDMLDYLGWESHETRSKLQLIVLYKIVHGLIDIPPTDYLTQTNSRIRSAHKYKYKQYSTSTDCFKYSFFPEDNPTLEQITTSCSRGSLLRILQEGAVWPNLLMGIYFPAMDVHPNEEWWAVSSGLVPRYPQGRRIAWSHSDGRKMAGNNFSFLLISFT